jgi:hypothetical protein
MTQHLVSLKETGEVDRNSPHKAGSAPRLNPSLRFVLIALFGSSGIWLICYSIALLNTSRAPIPTGGWPTIGVQ